MVAEFERLDAINFAERLGIGGRRALYDYWRRLVHFGRLPSRLDIDPMDIGPLLPGIVMTEPRETGALISIRIAGTRVVELIGTEPAGLSLAECHPAAIADQVIDAYEAAMHLIRPVALEISVGGEQSLDIVALPMTATGGRIDMVLAFYQGSGPIAPHAGDALTITGATGAMR